MQQLIKNLLAPKTLLFFAIGYTLAILWGSLLSPSDIPKIQSDVSDKTIHFFGYLFLVVLWFSYFFFKQSSKRFFSTLFFIAIAASLFGIVIEILQEQTTKNRTGDVYDIFANVLGVIVAGIILLQCRKTLIKLKKRF